MTSTTATPTAHLDAPAPDATGRATTSGARRVPLSVLDLATVSEGSTGQHAIRASIDLAVAADALGYHRLWFAEHHLAPGVASAAPAVLAALAADRTSRLRVGSGAVLLSTTSPLVAAEQFGSVAALHPGRVDLGVGRAFSPPPTDGGAPPPPPRPRAEPRVVDGLPVPAPPPIDLNDSAFRERLLAQKRVIGASRTPASLRDELELVLGLRAGTYRDADGAAYVSPPAEGAAFDLWVLASSPGESARVAGELGLPLAANYHVSPSATLETVAAYRAAFRPGVLAAPYVLVSADVLVAADDAHAQRLAAPFPAWVRSIRTSGSGAVAYPRPGSTTPWHELDDATRELVRDRVETRVVGDPDTVVERLETLQRVTGADELLVTTVTHDKRDTVRSFELLAGAWGLSAGAPAVADALAR
ncbi:LLM class flavin-dependent oxidoreductase [Cellulomonas sp. NPDC055163]